MIYIKNNKTVFSIIVPAYNSAEYIKKCIESVLEQTYSRFELILVDDGSLDTTLEICKAYAEKDSRIRVFHKENGGHTSARNEGLKNAIGEYILFLDSDDWIHIHTLKTCYDEIVKNEPDILIYRMENSDSTSPYKISMSDGCYKISDLERNSQNNFIISETGNFVFPKSLSAKCFKCDAIYNAQMQIPKDVLIGEDGAAFIDSLLNAQKISVIAGNENACYYCLVRSNSISRSADKSAFEKATSLLLHYDKIFKKASADYSSQFNRNVVAQLYTAVLLVLRSGGSGKQINNGLNIAMKHDVIKDGLRRARFSLNGYKFIIKKLILRFHLWSVAKLLDRINI